MAFVQNGGSSTCVVEAPPIELHDMSVKDIHPRPFTAITSGMDAIETRKGQQHDDPVESLPSPTTQAAAKLERWYTPKINLYRTFAAFWSFIVMGANDAAYGVCFLISTY